MNNQRSALLRRTRRVSAALAGAVLAAGVCVTGTSFASGESSAPTPALNQLEREAQVHLAEARRERVQQENRRAARPQHAPPNAEACRALLAQTWRELGRFSDGYETYLMRRPPCVGL